MTAVFPKTADQWQLYTATAKTAEQRSALEKAAAELTAGLKKATKAMLTEIQKLGIKRPAQAYAILNAAFESHLQPIMETHAKLGAFDTEPRAVARLYLAYEVKQELGIEGKCSELGEL